MKEILVKTLMSEDVTSLPPETPLQKIVKEMVEQRYSCIVISQNQSPIGIVTERDLVKVLNQEAQEIDLSLPVVDFMSSPVLSVNVNGSLFDAIVISQAEHIRHLPVVDEHDSLVGLVTQSDLTNAYFQIIEAQSETIDKSVAEKTGQLQQLNDELQALSLEDHLMKIGNRRAMEVDLEHTHHLAIRYDSVYSVILFDIDYFKLYNDHYGHQAGDDALIAVADILKANIRGADRLYRYGGEEVLLVMPSTNAAEAEKVAKKLVSSIANSAIAHEKSPFNVLTISCGGASVLKDEKILNSWKELIELVDHNLYQAKDSGRNLSVVTF